MLGKALPIEVSATAASQPHGGLIERALLWAAKRAMKRSAFHHGDGIARTTDTKAYDDWRANSLIAQLTDHFDETKLAGKDILDFGCGSGELTTKLVERFGARSAVGVDLSKKSLSRAKEKREALSTPHREKLQFDLATDPKRIDIESESIDIICCFDVLEHIPNVRDTVAEWHRVLRAGGSVWIWWSPWRGPYGHHVESLLPLPWVHLLVCPKTIFRVCADVYDDPSFVPRYWDYDAETGKRRPNKWRGHEKFEPFLNKLTRANFERIAKSEGLSIAHRLTKGFQGSRASRATNALTILPILGECFVSYFAYELRKPLALSADSGNNPRRPASFCAITPRAHRPRVFRWQE